MSLPTVGCHYLYDRGAADRLTREFRAPWLCAAEAYIAAKLTASNAYRKTRLPPMQDDALVAECRTYLDEFRRVTQAGFTTSDRMKFGLHGTVRLDLSFDPGQHMLTVRVVDETPEPSVGESMP